MILTKVLCRETQTAIFCLANLIWYGMRWAGHVARMGEGRGVHRVLVGKPEGKRPLGDPDLDGRIILRWIFGKWEGVETGWSCFKIETDGGHL